MPKTYNDIYIHTRKNLKEAGIEAYSQEARILVAEAAGKTTEKLMQDMPLYASEDFEKKVEDMTARRIAGEPLAYITGSWEFYGVPLEVTRDVLIPRPDTELMVDAAIRLFTGRNMHPRILDLCAGSGCIGIALAVRMPGSRVILVDNDHKALAVCRRNVKKHGLETRVMCIDADATKKPPLLMGSFDLITCNAPYVPTAEIETLDSSVRDYEPYAALDGGEDGLDIIRVMLPLWKAVLSPKGTMMLEIGEGQAEEVCRLLSEEGFPKIGTLTDAGGTERIIVGQR